MTPLAFGRDYRYDDYTRLDDVLRETDVLVLCHGAKGELAMQANCDSFVAIIERFRSLTRDRRFPVEVWAVGSEIEFHPTFGVPALRPYLESKRAFARHARGYWRDRTFVYRHIVPAAFRSRMGPGLMSGTTAVPLAVFHPPRLSLHSGDVHGDRLAELFQVPDAQGAAQARQGDKETRRQGEC